MASDALDRLTALVTEVARSPEMLYVAASALADELDRLAVHDKEAKSVRHTAKVVKPMIGLDAEFSWEKLSWREKFRNRKRKDSWQQEFTAARLEEGRRRVAEALSSAR
jgi:hypothetical protein